MNSAQRVIKYLAVAFAIFLTVNIIFGIVMAITSIFGITSLISTSESTGEITYNEIFSNIKDLEIDIEISKLYVKEGNEFRVEARGVSSKFNVENVGEKLKIKEKKPNIFKNAADKSEIYVYIPANTKLNSVKISTGISKSEISNVISKRLDLNMGVGDLSISNIIISEDTKIDGGVGRANIEKSDLRNLDLDCGVGSIDVTTKLTGNSKISCGVGNLNVSILGNKNDYTIKTDTGIGTMKVDGDKVADNQTVGNGSNFIRLDGGVGTVSINFTKTSETDF